MILICLNVYFTNLWFCFLNPSLAYHFGIVPQLPVRCKYVMQCDVVEYKIVHKLRSLSINRKIFSVEGTQNFGADCTQKYICTKNVPQSTFVKDLDLF